MFELAIIIMRCFSCCACCAPLWTRNPNRRSSILLFTMAVMIIYTLQYDVSYPYEYEVINLDKYKPKPLQLDKHDRGNKSCELCTFYPVSGVAMDIGFKCFKTFTRPQTTVCVYDEWSDMYISHDIQYTGMWEPHVMYDFQQLLGKCHSSGLIDLGANIGFYTLLAAKMGHKVFAVEPTRESIYRIHRALYLEGLGDRVYVLENGISDERGDAVVRLSGNNQGDNRIETGFRHCTGKHCPPVVKTILLDDVYRVIGNNFTSAILKMDIQGYEHRAFKHASKLFDNIKINYVLMEWFLLSEHYVDEKHTSAEKTLVEDTLTFLFNRDFKPFELTSDGGKPLDPSQWHHWPYDVIWIRMPDAIEQRTIMSTHYRNWPT